ncbi:MAG: UDP-N-acetylglucosamine 4,6-dehydratase (inverting) [Bacteroidota bacterium]
MLELNGKSILVTGGTGSFGKAFVATVLQRYPQVRRLVVFSRDELKQFEMQQQFPMAKYPAMRYFIGDVRDRERLRRAFEGVDYVIHAAAMKQVPAAEYNPTECIRTNIHGAENVIAAAMDNDVRKVVALSTDKAAAPINLYGATKLCSDKLFIAANNMIGHRDLQFSVVRYGNVMGSRGSVIPFFLKKRREGILPITHAAMTRFNISLDQGIELVLHALEHAWGGEIFVPKIPSFRITDLAEAVAPQCEVNIVGIRPGEKLHEEMITPSDSLNTLDIGDRYVIVPTSPRWDLETFKNDFDAQPVPFGFHYRSDNNDKFLSVEQLRQEIRQHVDPNFTI